METITVYPSGYINNASASISNITNAYTSTDSTTYAQINLTTGRGALTDVFFTFDLSSIPSNAIIQSVECSVKVLISTTSSNYINTRSMRMYSGNTAKGSGGTSITTSSTVVSLSSDTWTRDELNDCRIRLYVTRGPYSTNTTRYLRFYGANLTVTYSVPVVVPIVGKSIINGTSKELINGYTTIDGVQKQIVKSYANINGVWCPTWGEKITYGDLSLGETITLNVNGTPYEWIVVHQGNPGTSKYDTSCNGTWLLMKNCYNSMAFSTSSNLAYGESDINTYLNGTFLRSLDSSIQSIVKEVTIPVYVQGDNSSLTTLTTKIFLLSFQEIDLTASAGAHLNPKDGLALDYFNGGDDARRIAYYGGSAKYWWTRSPWGNDSRTVVKSNGDYTFNSVDDYNYVRPAMIMPSNAQYDVVIGGMSATTFTWKKYNVNTVETGNYILAESSTGTTIAGSEGVYGATVAATLDIYDKINIDRSTGVIKGTNFIESCDPWTATYSHNSDYAELDGIYYRPYDGKVWSLEGVGTVSGGIFYKQYAQKETKQVCGDYIADVTATNGAAYSTNGVHSDGYWYILQ